MKKIRNLKKNMKNIMIALMILTTQSLLSQTSFHPEKLPNGNYEVSQQFLIDVANIIKEKNFYQKLYLKQRQMFLKSLKDFQQTLNKNKEYYKQLTFLNNQLQQKQSELENFLSDKPKENSLNYHFIAGLTFTEQNKYQNIFSLFIINRKKIDFVFGYDFNLDGFFNNIYRVGIGFKF